MEKFKINLRHSLAATAVIFLYGVSLVVAAESSKQPFEISGYLKSLNFFTKTSGSNPEMVEGPQFAGEEHESVFLNLNRARIKLRSSASVSEGRDVYLRADYDHQPQFGSFVATGDFRLAHYQDEERQFLDLSQTLAEGDAANYEHRFYRLIGGYRTPDYELAVGRQQIPWGVGHFFTPTDVFNPFNPLQIELDERHGVDAANLEVKDFMGLNTEIIYTPRGGRLHPQRIMSRLSWEHKDNEVAVLGGRIAEDEVIGFDLMGNYKDSAVRAEFLWRDREDHRDPIKFTINADHNFAHNIYALIEYHFNGEGRNDERDYQRDRFIKGEIQQLGKNYLANLLGYDITPLIRAENRTIFNMSDGSVFMRPEVRYEFKPNFLWSTGSQLFMGSNEEELGEPFNLYFSELKYSF